MIAIGILVALAIVLVIRTHKIHIRLSKERDKKDQLFDQTEVSNNQIIEQYTATVVNCISTIQDIYDMTLNGLQKENLKELKNANKRVKQLNSDTRDLKVNLHQTISRLNEEPFESGSHYVQIIDDVRDLVHCITFIVKPGLDHVDYYHKRLTNTQFEGLNDINQSLKNFFRVTRDLINSQSVFEMDLMTKLQQEILKKLDDAKVRQIRRIKKAEAGIKNSILYLSILQETKNLVLITYSLLKSHREFISSVKK